MDENCLDESGVLIGIKDSPETTQTAKSNEKQQSPENQETVKDTKSVDSVYTDVADLANTAENAQKLSKVEPSSHSAKLSSPSDQKIDQKTKILCQKLTTTKRQSSKVGGTLGRTTEVFVNCLSFKLNELFKKTVYHMDVVFTPESPRRLLRTALEEFSSTHYPNVPFVFDGLRNMYTTKELKGKNGSVSFLNEENSKIIDFNIVTSIGNIINMKAIKEYLHKGSSSFSSERAFQALNIVLRNQPSALRFINIRESFFSEPLNTSYDLVGGIELWNRFYQNPVIGWKPYLNIDVTHRAFFKHPSLIKYISEDLCVNLNSVMDVKTATTLLASVKGIKVIFLVPNLPCTKRTFKVVGFLDNAANFKFEVYDYSTKCQQTVNIVQYFKKKFNYDVKYPNLPCFQVGNLNKKYVVPIELCTIQKGQTIGWSKLNETPTANMIENASQPSAEKKQTFESYLKSIKCTTDPLLNKFGIVVGEELSSVSARVLDHPSFAYAKNRETKPKPGFWKSQKLSKEVKLKKWTVLNLDRHTNIISIKNFEKHLISSGKVLNIIVSPMEVPMNCPIEKHWKSHEMGSKLTKCFKTFRSNEMELVVVIIPDNSAELYAIVKQTAELQVGVITQCVQSTTMSKMKAPTAGNILLKINSKLNGVNHTLAAGSCPVFMNGAIIFGACVSHLPNDQTAIPSIAAVAASHDISGSQYNMEWNLQTPHGEIIEKLEDLVHKKLIKFKEKTNTIPLKIFYFRDGVSTKQFIQLLEHELVAIRRACLRLNINYKPAVTILVVQKQQHTKMFPKYSIDMDGSGNITPGTIIDTHITHPTELDFYLCSHASNRGSTKPTKYHLIWDDNNLTEDQLEQLKFYLCFMFVRCTQSVSYPAPIFYAHLAAIRARTYIKNKF